MNFYYGIVEDRLDPLKIGRCKVRIVGLHTHDKQVLPTEDLPWATPMQPVNSASMNGIGWSPNGPVEGTSVIIIFADEEQQQPIMIGTVGGIPQSKLSQRLEQEQNGTVISDGGILTTSDGTPVVDGSGDPVTTNQAAAPETPPPANNQPNLTEQKKPNAASEETLKSDIPTKPPKGSTSNPVAAEQNIKHLLKACDVAGIKSKYAKCAILGICGGESGWLPVEEGHYYSDAEYLAKVFRRTFPGGAAEAQPWTKWKGSKADWFRKIYSPEGNGSLVGHKHPDDGAKYYGRGFNQITGKALYQQLQDWLKGRGITVDLIGNPSSLISDPYIAALASVAFYAKNVKHDQNDPGYFRAALKRTGADANGTGYKKKEKYYQYFLGENVIPESTNKPAADDQKTYTKEEVEAAVQNGTIPPAKAAAFLEDRSSAQGFGFQDPNQKYPLRNLLDEPDTNRLARQIQKETAIEFKDSTRTKQISSANDEDNWEQPLAPFGGIYPYAKVYESESGHLFILDDTPANENVSLYHKSGSFIEIDANGTQVNKIMGDGYSIIERNGSVYIGGMCRLTVGNGVNILVQGAADIEVMGNSNINLHNNASVGVAGDFNMAVGGDYNLQVGGTFKVKSAGDIITETTGKFNAKAGSDMFMQAGGASNIKAAGNVNIDGAQLHMEEGAAGNATATGISFVPPSFEIGTGNQISYLQTPARPSPPIQIKAELLDALDAELASYNANPDNYRNPTNEGIGVKPNLLPPPNSGEVTPDKVQESGASKTDIIPFLEKQLEAAKSGYWRETGQKGAPSNKNILRLWSDIGFPPSWGGCKSDQVPWCAAFVNWALKNNGYKYCQDGLAFSFDRFPQRWGLTRVSPGDAQPGDIAVFSGGHVAFVYKTVKQGQQWRFIGGNQSPAKGAEPPVRDPNNDGDVTNTGATIQYMKSFWRLPSK